MQTPLPARRPPARKLACAGAAPSARAGLFRGIARSQTNRTEPLQPKG